MADVVRTHLALLDGAAMGPRQYAIWLLASGGTLLDGFSIFSLGVAMALVTQQFNLSPLMVGLTARLWFWARRLAQHSVVPLQIGLGASHF